MNKSLFGKYRYRIVRKYSLYGTLIFKIQEDHGVFFPNWYSLAQEYQTLESAESTVKALMRRQDLEDTVVKTYE